ncbi:hypothetical protein [Kocuria sp. KH4]
MAGTLITVTTGAGGLAAAVAIIGLGLSVGAGHAPGPASMGLLVAGIVVLILGFVSNFEHRSRRWVDEMDAQLQARRCDLQLLGVIPGQSPQMRPPAR